LATRLWATSQGSALRIHISHTQSWCDTTQKIGPPRVHVQSDTAEQQRELYRVKPSRSSKCLSTFGRTSDRSPIKKTMKGTTSAWNLFKQFRTPPKRLFLLIFTWVPVVIQGTIVLKLVIQWERWNCWSMGLINTTAYQKLRHTRPKW